MSIEYTAKGSGYYRVFVDDVQVSKHITEREALEAATNAALNSPESSVFIDHDYKVEVMVDILIPGLVMVPQIDPPIVDAGGPYSGTVSTPISLNATVTPGDDPSPTLSWSIVSGGTGTFSSTSIEDPTFTPDSSATYTLRLTATPSAGSPVTDDATLTSSAASAFNPAKNLIFDVGTLGTKVSEFSSGGNLSVYSNDYNVDGTQCCKSTALANQHNTDNFGGYIGLGETLYKGDEFWYRAQVYWPTIGEGYADSYPYLKFLRLQTFQSDGTTNAGFIDIYIGRDGYLHWVKEGPDEPYRISTECYADYQAWHTFEVYYRLSNTTGTGSSDALVRFWFDGNPVGFCSTQGTGVTCSGSTNYDLTGHKTLTNAGDLAHTALLFTFWNNSAAPYGPSIDQDVYFDNVTIATSNNPPTSLDSRGNPFIGTGTI